ncbi:hypothetical protein [Confluentibacter sediminis]|uniref:hypothetical protein n=1 Tax=Confluentibacter sediminis TaxID=2219045 RepID=UPI000DACD708|nr:hypothetical protein [Confluentibacter sediminis]
MKFYLKNYLKVGILFFGISLIITNCQKEDVRPTETQKIEQPPASISINYVQGENIPNILSLLDPDYSSYSKANSSKSTTVPSPFGSISIENILEVIDTLGNQNYSFSLIPITPKPNSIFNLVVGKSNEATDMAIVEYRMSPDFAEAYYNGTKSMGEFTGSIITFPFNAAATNMFSKSSGNTCVQNIDEVVNCDQINVDNGTVVSSGGSGNTGTTGIGGTNTYTGGNGSDVTQDYGGGSASWVCSCNETHASPSECNCTNTTGGAGSRGARGAWIITLPDSHTSKSSNTKGKSITGSCCDGANLDGSVGINAYRTELANSISLILRLLNTSEEAIWLNNDATVGQLTSIRDFLASNKGSVEAKGFAKAQMAIEILTDPQKIKLEPKNGKLNNRDDQEYTHFGSNGTYNVYQLKDGSRVLKSPWPLKINTDGKLVNDTSNQDTGESWYIKPIGESLWSNYLLKESINLSEELRKTALLTGTALAKAIGTYVLPIEDIKILITGSDFDGEQVSRLQTGGFMIVGVVPGGKVLKPLSKGTGKIWKIVIKNGDKVFSRSVKELTEETIQHFDNYAEGARDLLQEALRKGDILDDEIIIEIGQEISDLSAKKGRKLTWEEVKVLFKRGQDFNNKARELRWYKYNEVHLTNGKRLDGYTLNNGGEIVSRKATDLGNIKFSSFENYLKEMRQKYPTGTQIRSNKYPEIDGQFLLGKQILEIPASNQSLSNIQTFIDFAKNNYHITIRFRPE